MRDFWADPSGHRRPALSAAAEIAVWGILLAAAYLATVSAWSVPEAVAGAGLGLLGGTVARVLRRASGTSWRLRFGWARWLLVLPVAVLADTSRLYAMASSPTRLRRENGLLRTVEPPADPEPVGRGRVGLGGWLVSTSPGSLLIDEQDDGTLLLHLQVSGRPDVTALLGRSLPGRDRAVHSTGDAR